MICEKCWGRAYTRSLGSDKSQAECYKDILAETEESRIIGVVPEPKLKELVGKWSDDQAMEARGELACCIATFHDCADELLHLLDQCK